MSNVSPQDSNNNFSESDKFPFISAVFIERTPNDSRKRILYDLMNVIVGNLFYALGKRRRHSHSDERYR
ncbi:hypothetical protein U1Q18_046554 [Sarracenia purpurea var. burkii]